ncbi:MAG: bifunctional UDP-3-O-[3-hydroxymyristoyl] N-acetylglucosamine deacetylase/3-hydroxyacyl-ACP dehydratase [Bacteroidia bacterium]|nr:bifunctional UDP-3-O-[3-hydroxymyristoyl] N-acetylglucosamine deacetylase/3-hydroxyacyl-ACP dehydratase [Bacteroidia bacterium]
MPNQRTLKQPVSVKGVGLHTGKVCTLTLNPAPENTWFVFRRTDLEGCPSILADADNVKDTARGTKLEQNGASISTTEHVLAALLGMEVDNCFIDVDGPEVPILDGSSKPFVHAIEKAGIAEQNAERVYFELKHNLTFEDPQKKVEMLAVPQDDFRITVMVDYNSDLLGTQHASMYHLKEFKDQISMCRTFVFLHELEMLLQHNLIKGGDLDNAIVMVDKPIPDDRLNHLRKVFNKESVEVKGRGVLNNTKLHFYNEPARHKLLDIVGDLALVGMPVKAHILAARPGHAGNVSFAGKIKEVIKAEKSRKDEFHYDLSGKPLYDINDIMKILPHRSPFLFVDKIMEMSKEHVVGVKNVAMNEPFFAGHFPGAPVMPGVIQVETMAQVGGVLVLKTVPDPENYLTYFMKIDGVKFKQKVLPGDTMVFLLRLMAPIRRGICQMRGVAYVNGKPVLEAELMAQIVKVKNPGEPALVHSS